MNDIWIIKSEIYRLEKVLKDCSDKVTRSRLAKRLTLKRRRLAELAAAALPPTSMA